MYPSLKTTRKLDKIDKTSVFRHWAIGNTGLWSLREGKLMRWGLRSPAFCLKAHSDFTAGTKIPSRAETEIRIQEAWGFWKMWSKVLERRELSRKKSSQIYMGVALSLLNIKACMYRMKFYKVGQRMTRVLWAEWFPELTQSWESSNFHQPKWRVLTDHSRHSIQTSEEPYFNNEAKLSLV